MQSVTERISLDGAAISAERFVETYEDIKPYYDRLDRMVGIFGTNEGLENEPDGVFMPPPKPRCYERAIQKAGRKLGIPVIPSRMSILTQPLGDRPACHYCSQCGRGCTTHSNFSTPSVLLPPALTTGKLTVFAQGFTAGNQFSGPIVITGPATIPGGQPQYALPESEPLTLMATDSVKRPAVSILTSIVQS